MQIYFINDSSHIKLLMKKIKKSKINTKNLGVIEQIKASQVFIFDSKKWIKNS